MTKKQKNKKSYKPDWVPENAGAGFATSIVKGVEIKNKLKNYTSTVKKRDKLIISDYVNGVINNNRSLLGRTITLIESNSSVHYELAQEVLKGLLPFSGKSIRIGITGSPGVGKSTFIESLGMHLIHNGYKVAVLAIDPSSSITKGSILGDKTRMQMLSREEKCFIRPSPTGGTLGGVARKSRETMLVCEAAGYDVILVETVGVGQSEITVRSMVDFFLLIMVSGTGDELQGIKKGVIELADALVINKAEGDNKPGALRTMSEFQTALKYIAHATKGWETNAFLCSAVTGENIEYIWKVIKEFEGITKQTGIFEERRKSQAFEWVFSIVDEQIKKNFYDCKEIQKAIKSIKEKVIKGEILPTSAASEILKHYNSQY